MRSPLAGAALVAGIALAACAGLAERCREHARGRCLGVHADHDVDFPGARRAAAIAAAGQGGLAALPDHPGLSAPRRTVLRGVVRRAVAETARADAWDNTALVVPINEWCEVDLPAVVMVP